MLTQQQLSRLYALFAECGSISTDSRHIEKGAIFFALRGESFDGNRFAEAALQAGAALAVVDNRAVIPASPQPDPENGYFLVEDTLEALQALAMMHRQRLGIPILAITGTNGKTTTKELIAAVMSAKFRVCATQGNLNNHIGVPLTILRMPRDTEFGIVEMGASSQGEIAALCRIAHPDYGVITNVGRAHLEGFGGEEGVKAAKGELYDWLAQSGGRAFVRSDDETLCRMAAKRNGLDVVWYESAAADGYRSSLAGGYNRYNVAAAVTAGLYFGIPEDSIYTAIRDYVPSTNRSRIVVTDRNTVIADCYNANPSSMQAALEWFGSLAPDALDEKSDSKMAILGDMLELGEWSAEEHRRMLALALGMELRTLVLIGREFAAAAQNGLPASTDTTVTIFPDTESYISYLRCKSPVPGRKTVLLKGSRGMALEQVLNYL